MGKDKEKTSLNPSFKRKKESENPSEIDETSIYYWRSKYGEERKLHSDEREYLISFYKKLCLYFIGISLISGFIIGLIVGTL